MVKIMSNLMTKMKASLFARLSKNLMPYITQENQCSNQESKKSNYNYNLAVLAPSAQLSPESSIENFAGSSDRISVGEHSYIRGRLLTWGHGGAIKIGEWSYVGLNTEIWSMDDITIGNRVLISHGVNIHDGTAHSLDAVERHAHFKHILEKGHYINSPPGVNSAPIIIEDDVWINFGVSILKGVRIGKGSVIAAGSIVAEDVPPGVIYKCKITPQITVII